MSMLAVIRSGSLPLTHSRAPPVSKTAQLVSTNSTWSSLDFSESALVCGIAKTGFWSKSPVSGSILAASPS